LEELCSDENGICLLAKSGFNYSFVCYKTRSCVAASSSTLTVVCLAHFYNL